MTKYYAIHVSSAPIQAVQAVKTPQKGLVINLRKQVLHMQDLVPFTETGKLHTCIYTSRT